MWPPSPRKPTAQVPSSPSNAVHAAPHIPLGKIADAIGADIITCSAYKFFGPHVGVTAIRRDLFEKMGV